MHTVAILLLALVTLPLPMLPDLALDSVSVPNEDVELEEEFLDVDLQLDPETLDETVVVDDVSKTMVKLLASDFQADDITPLDTLTEAIDFGTDLSEFESVSADSEMSGSRLEGRRGTTKANLLRTGGGTKSSEKAVQNALYWIARHQYADGSWNFDHTHSECGGRCENPGSMTKSRAGATGLALMTYLGAGHTHHDGTYRRLVDRGIVALARMVKLDKNGASFKEPQGNMYSHGIATMAICEAYAMTGDPALHDPAQAAINFICYAQDPTGGGWRYQPREAGDTSVMGWQIGALKSGYLSQLSVPSVVIRKAKQFLYSVSVMDGAGYGYTADPKTLGQGPSTTAIGLLCRMYMGIDRHDPGLQSGMEFLSKRGPSGGNVYYNYYATQVLYHHTGGKGPVWKRWNEKMRDQLVNSQIQEGHAAGSWTPAETGDHGGKSGGRLYTTAMSAMTLEVYYRMMPMYREQATSELDLEQ